MTQEELKILNDKYDLYLNRLKKYFVVIDDPKKDGTNLPAAFRNLYGRTSNIIGWGDTTIHMAYYISVLTTDLYLKISNKENYSTELLHLDYAVKSLERLDYNAEKYYRPSGNTESNDLNGFYIREDVPDNFLIQYPELSLSEGDGFGSVTQVNERYDWIDYTNPQIRFSEMSQDQSWSLLLGIGFSLKILDMIPIQYKSDIITIKNKLRTFVFRTTYYMLEICKGHIKNPITKKPVLRGDNTTLFSWGFAKAAEEITGYPFTKYVPFGRKFIFNNVTRISENIVYPYVAPKIKKIKVKDYSYKALSIMGDCRHNNKLFDNLCNNFNNTLRHPHFPLMYYIIHGNKNKSNSLQKYHIDKLEELLTSFNGSFYFGQNDTPTNKIWGNNLINGEYNCVNEPERWNTGSYNGIDFLLLTNLYKIIKKY